MAKQGPNSLDLVHPLEQDARDPKAEKIVQRAQRSHPEALRMILARLAGYLRGETRLPREYALFCAKALTEFTESDVMKEAGAAFREQVADKMNEAIRQHDDSDPEPSGSKLEMAIMFERGPRLQEIWIRGIGVSFGRAFRLRRDKEETVDSRSIGAAVPELPPHIAHPLSQRYFDFRAMMSVEAAKRGDPEPLRSILGALAGHLRGKVKIPREYARFCADALTKFSSSMVMTGAGQAFDRLGGTLPVDAGSDDRGFWCEKPDLRKIERTFCRIFYLSKPPGKDIPKSPALCPPEAWKVYELRFFGASRKRAIDIVISAYPSRTARSLDTWVREMEFEEPKRGTLGWHRLEQRRLKLGIRVLRETSRGASLEEACSTVAREAVQELARLPRATIFLKSKTVERAYHFALDCRADPRWDRIWTYLERRFKRPPPRRREPA